jgi:uncharacterized protein YdeI (YjbR/CyaY-like superfamily)
MGNLRLEREIISFQRASDFEFWLEAHHTQATGIWIQIMKKGSGLPSITYQQALECALCFGWIDGQKAKQDGNSWLQYFSKRKKNSIWSQVNRKNSERLILEGRMQSPGAAAIEEAKRSGAWDAAYQPTRSREIPVELDEALAKSKKARDFFEALDSHNRFAFVFRVSTARKEETRLKRVNEYIRMMENREVFYPKKVK